MVSVAEDLLWTTMIVTNAMMTPMQAPTANHGNQRKLEFFDVGTPLPGIVGVALPADVVESLAGVAIGPSYTSVGSGSSDRLAEDSRTVPQFRQNLYSSETEALH
jgi:hypothetical protein